MAATPFKLQLTLQGLDGSVQVEPATCSDVADALASWLSTSNNFVVAKTDSYMTDISLSAAGVDTSRLALYVNGRDTGISYMGAGLVCTVNNRMPSKPGIGAGASIQVKQLT